jgi:hypothetical protein
MVLPSWQTVNELISDGLTTTLKALLGVSTVLHAILPAFTLEGDIAKDNTGRMRAVINRNSKRCFRKWFNTDML